MSPTAVLALAAAVFLLTHFVPSTPLRGALVRSLGERAYLGLYTVLALATIAWMIWAFARAPYVPLWSGDEFKAWALLIMPLALVLLACGVTSPNPTAVRQEAALRSTNDPAGILRVTRHPVMWAIGLWALVHLAARGDEASVIFFGTFALLAFLGTVLIDARKRRTLGIEWTRFADVTSNVPFGAILRGRNRLRVEEIGWWRLGLGLALYVVLLLAHPWLFGVRPW
jgi:uncharacterized membrane protein